MNWHVKAAVIGGFIGWTATITAWSIFELVKTFMK
jgi:hypothetical protein